MWSKRSHHLFGEFRFISGRFGRSKGSNPNTTCLHCHGGIAKTRNQLDFAKSTFFSRNQPIKTNFRSADIISFSE